MAPIIFHGLERLLINIGAIFIAYLGYRLFMFGVEKGHGKLEAHSAMFKVVFSGSSPGLFFMVSGLVILVVSLVTGKVEIYEKQTRRGSVKKVSTGLPSDTKNKKRHRNKQTKRNKNAVTKNSKETTKEVPAKEKSYERLMSIKSVKKDKPIKLKDLKKIKVPESICNTEHIKED